MFKCQIELNVASIYNIYLFHLYIYIYTLFFLHRFSSMSRSSFQCVDSIQFPSCSQTGIRYVAPTAAAAVLERRLSRSQCGAWRGRDLQLNRRVEFKRQLNSIVEDE